MNDMPVKPKVRADGLARYGRVIPARHANPARALGDLGTKLLELVANHEEAGSILLVLWRRYAVDCERNGVEPVLHEMAQRAFRFRPAKAVPGK